jgi:small-conductance mechanosensitive channel
MAFLHPAGVVPFLRVRRLDGPALVVGAVAADFEYFAALSAHKHVHPNPVATLVVGVVVGVVLLALLAQVGPGVSRALPLWAVRRFAAALTRPFAVSRWGSVVVGAATHVLLDALTHKGPLLSLVPGLPVRTLSSASLPVGLVVIALAIALAPAVDDAGAQRQADPRWPRHLAIVVVAAAVGAAALAALRAFGLTGSAADVMAAGSAGAIAGVCAAGVVLARRTG